MRIVEVVPGELFTDEMDGGDFVVRTAHQLQRLDSTTHTSDLPH